MFNGFDYVIVDVFTTTKFGGNQLAVFPDAAGIPDEVMQALAREFNFAETTFVLPATQPGADFRVRIFTPRKEVPFAGHPTIGTAAALWSLGRVRPMTDCHRIMLEERVGLVPVDLQREQPSLFARLRLETSLETSAPAPSIQAVTKVLSLCTDDVQEVHFASVGLPFCYVQIASPQAVDRATLDRTAWKTTLEKAWSPNVFLYSGDTTPGGRLHARMFAPALGIEEDPATGSACAALAGVLAQRGDAKEREDSWTVDQGVAMGRPSRIEMSARVSKGKLRWVSVGGSSVVVGEGRMRI